MATRRKPPVETAIITKRLPVICPACAFSSPDWLREAGGVTRLTCPRCAWTERYRVMS